jgi:hypothetical protein
MSNSLPVSNSYRPPRRSTRVNQAATLTVTGLDCYRGPYQEQVSTLTVNCHGCKYLSKYEVLPTSSVILELNDEKRDSPPLSVRGHVKWVQRPIESKGGLFETAVELDNPGNIWGIDQPPSDWQPFCGPRNGDGYASRSKPFAVPKPEQTAITSKNEEHGKESGSHENKSALSPSSGEPRVGQLMGQFQRQMEKMLSEAAVVAVQERAASTFDEIRAGLREEAKRNLAEALASHAGPWIEQSLQQMKQASREYARALHSQWTKRIEVDVQQALGRIEGRHRELEQHSRSLAANTVDRVQEFLETCRKDAVDRIVARLKEQTAPQLDQARKVAADLAQQNEQMERLLGESMEKFSLRIEEACTGFEKQFEQILRERVDTAREEFERGGNEATALALDNLRITSKRLDTEAQAQLRNALEGIAETTFSAFKEKMAETSRQFAGELTDYSRSHLAFVGGAISELAKGIGKLSRD